MISRSRRDSVGGGVVVEFFRDPQKQTRFSGGWAVAEFFRDPQKPTRFSGGGGGVVAGIFRRDTHFFLDTPKIRISCWKIKDHSNCPNSVRFFYISVRPGDQE